MNMINDIYAFTYAENGAMGDPGSINIISKSNSKVELSKYETIYDEVMFNRMMKLLPEIKQFFEKQPLDKSWNHVYMGAGNHLFLRYELYQKLQKKYSHMLESEIYATSCEEIMDICEKYNIKKPYTIIEAIRLDITKIYYCDAIVNAANRTLLGGGGVDGAIHKAAGTKLLDECQKLHGCETGNAKITNAYKLPCEKVIHTVGPKWYGGNNNEPEVLKNCYINSLEIARKHKLRAIAFPSISTGIYGYPVEQAAQIAVNTVDTYIRKYPNDFDRITWVLFDDNTKEVYKNVLDSRKTDTLVLNEESDERIKCLVKMLSSRKNEDGIENPYARQVCSNNLEIYLKNMIRVSPKVILVGEAPGYKGCARTGIPFTDEYHMMKMRNHKVLGNDRYDYQVIDSSKELEKEKSASYIWDVLENADSIPVMWNACPFHPYDNPDINTNRAPDIALQKEGINYLLKIIELFPNAMLYPIGRIAESLLNKYSIPHGKYIRHPSYGGSKICQEQLINILKREC